MEMSKFIKLAVAFCIAVNSSFVALAEDSDTSVTVSGYSATISGSTDSGEGTTVSLAVVRRGKDMEGVAEDSMANADNSLNASVVAIGQALVDNSGKYEYVCKFDQSEKSGIYTLRVQVYGDSEAYEEKFTFENAQRASDANLAVQGKTAEELKPVLEEYATDLDVVAGEQYVTYSDKEKGYVLTEIAIAENANKKADYISAVSDITAVRSMKALDKLALKALVDTGVVIGVSPASITSYNALTPLKKDLLVADLYTKIAGKETPDEIGTAFAEALSGVTTAPPQGGGGGGGGGGSSSSSTPNGTVTGNVGVEHNPSIKEEDTFILDTPSDEGFSDVASSHWAFNAISTLAEKGIISGRGENTFCPSDVITREEFLKLVVASLNIVGVSEDEIKFADVNKDAWYAHYVETGLASGVISGISETEFGIGRPITREDMATILYRGVKVAEYNMYSVADTDFADKDTISPYAQEAVTALSGAKVINGMEDGSFMPKKTATRAEAAMMLYNLLYR